MASTTTSTSTDFPATDLPLPVVLHSKTIDALSPETFDKQNSSIVSWKTLISAPQTATTSLTVGVATCPAGQGHLLHHRHTQPEIYHIVSGYGVVTVDGTEHAVSEGSVVYIPGDAEHGIRNEDPDRELRWLYVFGADSFRDIKYRFSA